MTVRSGSESRAALEEEAVAGVGVGEGEVDGAPDSKAKPRRRLAEAERRRNSESTAVRRSSEPRIVAKAALGFWAAAGARIGEGGRGGV